MNPKVQWAAKFIVAFYVMIILSTVAWEKFVDGYLYSCSDGVMGYPIPGDLLALSYDKWPLKFVPQVAQPTGIGDPDLIKEGWSARGLWALWASFLVASLATSVIIATLPWPASRRKP